MVVNIVTIKDIRHYLTRELNNIYQEPEISSLANIIIKTVLGNTKLHELYMNDRKLTPGQSVRITDICSELKRGKPIQYILGETIFYDCLIRLNSFTLIPRPETEELVDIILKENRGFAGRIIDLGTGSGCIAIALAKNLPGAQVSGTDISPEALLIARENAILNDVSVSFIKADILNPENENIGRVSLIVSNPPYVRNSEMQFMSSNVLNFEPHQALFVPDTDPLKYYKSILILADKILEPGGRLYLEINEVMGEPMTRLLESFRYLNIKVIADLNGRDRIIKGIKNV
jgi:release factor glutamine methyltransferase